MNEIFGYRSGDFKSLPGFVVLNTEGMAMDHTHTHSMTTIGVVGLHTITTTPLILCGDYTLNLITVQYLLKF